MGTLEDTILEGGEIVYTDLLSLAKEYIDSVPSNYQSRLKLANRKKALIGSVSNVLKPGKANATSFLDDNWISTQTIESVESHKQLYSFVEKILSY